jgi:signal transduction histidine kinase
MAFAAHMICLTILTLLPPPDTGDSDRTRLVLSYLAQMGSFLQIVFILFGSYQLVHSKPSSRRKFQLIVILTTIVAMVTVLIYTHDPQAGLLRYLFRSGSRSFISGAGFFSAGVLVWVNPKFTRGFGKRLLAFSFIAYSFAQFFHFSVVVANVQGQGIGMPGSFGLVNLLMIAVIGLSMIMWLLEDEREKLSKANKELDSFLYSTSHDLRAPIASILGLTYLGKLELQEEKARNFMGLIEDRVKKLDLIISDILNLSRTKKFEVRPEIIDFNKLLEETIVDIKFNKGASSISLIYEHDPQNIFKSDYHQIKVVLSNLLSNAVKYHKLEQENPYIKVVFTKSPDKIEFMIEDNGQGIPKESLSKIFDMFFRASPNTEGTGLGLYIVKEALTKIHGSIEVTSEFGRGTKFTVTLDHASVIS